MSDTPSPVVREAREHAELAIECLADVPRDHTGDLNYEKGATAIRALESAVERLDRELAEARRMLADAAKIAANVVASGRERDEARARVQELEAERDAAEDEGIAGQKAANEARADAVLVALEQYLAAKEAFDRELTEEADFKDEREAARLLLLAERDEARADADRLREAGRAFIATTSVFRQPKDSRDAFFYLAQLLVDPDTAALRGTDE